MTATPGHSDWTSSWEDDDRDKLIMYRNMSCSEKILAVEHLTEVANYFRKKTEASSTGLPKEETA
jgi:hypothetical protein